MFRWEEGRLGAGYYKFCLFNWWEFDCYILCFPKGSMIRPHTDPAPEGKTHYRLNILLPCLYTGGRFFTEKQNYCGELINFFSPSEELHHQEKITSGTKYQISFGWLW
jgi:hypothetical protein